MEYLDVGKEPTRGESSHLQNQIDEAVRILSDRDFLIPFFSMAEWPTTIRAVRREGKSSLKGYSAHVQKDALQKIALDLFLISVQGTITICSKGG